MTSSRFELGHMRLYDLHILLAACLAKPNPMDKDFIKAVIMEIAHREKEGVGKMIDDDKQLLEIATQGIPISSDFARIFTRMQSICTEIAQVDAAIAEAKGKVADAGKLLIESRKQLVKGDMTDEHAQVLQARLLDAERAKMVLNALHSKRAELDLAIPGLSTEFKKAYKEFSEYAVAAFLEHEYAPAVANFQKTLRRGLALSAALDGCEVLPKAATSLSKKAGAWQEDPDAQELHNEFASWKALSELLVSYTNKMAPLPPPEHRYPFDPDAYYIVQRVCRVNGVEFTEGTILSSENLDLWSLGRLHLARMVRPLDQEELEKRKLV